MRLILLLIFLSANFAGYSQQLNFSDKAVIYLVRHGEKQAGQDPLLSADGNQRAGDLFRVLKDSNIHRIYVTEYRRTQNTGDSLRIRSGIDTVHYASDTSCSDLLQKIKANRDTGQPILIIGHSNTIPLVIGKLGLSSYPTDYIPDAEYDNLFILRFKNGEPYLLKTKFGRPSGKSASMQ